MIQDKVKTSLVDLIGWRNETVTGLPAIDNDNAKSNSGMYFQDFSGLVTVENIFNCQQDPNISDENFNTYLTNLVKAATIKVLTAIFNNEDFVENKVLYPFESDWKTTIPNNDSFVGFGIQLPKRKDLSWVINSVFTSFDGDDSVKLLLFHSSKKAPIEDETISVEENNETETKLNWNLNQFDYSGGSYYIGYLQSEITAKAVDRDWNKANVQSCFKTLRMHPISYPNWTTETLFDVEELDNESETFGLNFDITAYKDYTNIVERNKLRFVNAIGYQVAGDVLDLILKSVRTNRIERITEGQVLFEMEGLISPDLPRTMGITQKLGAEIKELKKTFVTGLKIRRGTIG
ncbi:MAG: hypothetical protein ACOC2F_00330 [Bacteroidota bacterium]